MPAPDPTTEQEPTKHRFPWWKWPSLILVCLCAFLIEQRRFSFLYRSWSLVEMLDDGNHLLAERYAENTWFHRKLGEWRNKYTFFQS